MNQFPNFNGCVLVMTYLLRILSESLLVKRVPELCFLGMGLPAKFQIDE